MFPVLFSVGKISVSSFGVFLALGFLLGIFLIWRLTRAWDLNEEKILDLILLTFIGGLFASRIYFALENWQYFMASPLNLFLINKSPGFSFWGGFLGGWLTLYAFARRKRLDFWQLADIAFVGLLGGLVLSQLGCFLGGCNIGIPSKAFFSVTMVGFVGKRWPIQAVEAVFLSIGLLKIWSQATHFHQRGKIAATGLILVGAAKLILEPLKQDHSEVIFPVFFILLGTVILYKVTKQNPITQFKKLVAYLEKLISDPKVRKTAIQSFSKLWYNQKTNIGWKLRNVKKSIRRSNVKFS
ncbi:prolipoprotein diacylglyceryl transferase [Candidatus Daviesbacteria bacterium]|nr:prolipoprotein diacylglyceryl transferase [Candidatus Daviesbacteria bacterium]